MQPVGRRLLQRFCLFSSLLLCFGVTLADIDLPLPPSLSTSSAAAPQRMTLAEAILLSLRNNPGLRSSQLDRVTQKFALEVAHNAFEPQYSFSGGGAYSNTGDTVYNIKPGVTLTTPLGTKITAGLTSNFGHGNDTSVTVSVDQPLLQGLSPDVNLSALHDAIDTEQINRLTYRATVMSTVTQIIKDYYAIVQAYNNLSTQQRELVNAQKTLENTLLEIKEGKKAPAEASQQRATLATQQLQIISQRNSVRQQFQTLLTDLGLSPYAKFAVDQSIVVPNFKPPDLTQSVILAMANSTTYQQALVGLKQNKRSLVNAIDAEKPQLDLTASITHDISNGGSMTPTANNNTVGFNLTVPIDNMSLKQTELNARIAIDKQRITLAQTRRSIVTDITNQLHNLETDKLQIKIGEDSVKYANQTLQDDLLKFKYGKITSFELTSDRSSLISAQLSLISNKITYIQDVATFEQTLGLTLDNWHITVRY